MLISEMNQVEEIVESLRKTRDKMLNIKHSTLWEEVQLEKVVKLLTNTIFVLDTKLVS